MTSLWNGTVPLLAAIIGGLIVHLTAAARGSRNERRGRRVEHLISAYQRIIAAAHRPGGEGAGHASAFEAAVNDVMLLGQQKEVEAAHRLLLALRDGSGTDLEPLLEALRTSLREELALDKTPLPKHYFVRMPPRT
ncbi:MAG: hypothetical protein QG608_2377 [Actinomycetota bacterium]|nr:hypothetical protein [Actinomycetota bacterium]